MIAARSIRPDEIDRAGEIGAEAFEMDVEGWQKAFQRHVTRFDCDHVIVVEHEGTLVSAMMVTPEGLQMGEIAISGGAVGGVATVVAARRMGCAAAMMRETVGRMREWSIAGSAMWPFSFAYYRKFGWELGGECRFLKWPADIAWRVPADGCAEPLRACDRDDLISVWNAVAPRNRCATIRSTDVWDHILRHDGFGGGHPQKSGLVCRRYGKPVGYVLYDLPEPQEGEEPGPVFAAEFRALDGPAAVALIEGLTQATEAGKFCGAFSVDDRLRSIAVNPRAIETEVHASFGFRIVDPSVMLPGFRSQDNAQPLNIRIHDELSGTKTWRVPLNGAPGEATQGEPDVECDIMAFTQIGSGLLKPAAAAHMGLLTGDAAAVRRLDAATSQWTAPFRSGLEEG